MKRRRFIQLGGVAALSSPSSVAKGLASFAESPASTINVGVIGTGGRGQGMLGLLEYVSGYKVVSCCDRIPFRLQEARQQLGNNVKGFADYRQVLDDKDVDAVIVATTLSEHARIAIDALDAGKYVYCEKTMVKGIEAAREVTLKARSTNRIFQTGHQYRNSRLYSHVVDLIKGGVIGEITAIESQWNRNGDQRRPVPDPKWERQINWRMYREYSGGLVAELCSHHMDFCNWLLGDRADKISGFGGIDYWKDGRDTYDNVHIVCRYHSGVSASFTSLTANSLDTYQIKILAKEGSIVLTKNQATFYPEEIGAKEIADVDGVSGATVRKKRPVGYPIKVAHKYPTLQALLDFRKSILDNRQPLSNADTGAKVSVMVQMALNAMDNNTVEFWRKGYDF